MADSLKQLNFQVSDGLVFPLPEDTLCAELAEREVFYGDRSNLVEYSNALSSYQRLCSTTPTTPAEYMAWVNQSRSLQKKMNQLEHQDGRFNAELQNAVECYPESYLILSAAFHAVGAGVEESLIRAGRYQVEHPTVPLGAAQHFAAQQVEGPVLAVMNFWENYDAIQYAKAHKEQMPPAAYFQQMGASSVGVATPALAVLGLRAALKSGGGFQGGSLMAAGQDGLALAGVSAAGEGAAVASAGNFFAHSLLTFAKADEETESVGKAAEEQPMKTEGEGEASVPHRKSRVQLFGKKCDVREITYWSDGRVRSVMYEPEGLRPGTEMLSITDPAFIQSIVRQLEAQDVDVAHLPRSALTPRLYKSQFYLNSIIHFDDVPIMVRGVDSYKGIPYRIHWYVQASYIGPGRIRTSSMNPFLIRRMLKEMQRQGVDLRELGIPDQPPTHPLTQVDDPGLLAAEIMRDIELDHPVFVYDITGKFFYNRGEWLVPIVFGVGIGAIITFGLAMCNEAKGKKAQK